MRINTYGVSSWLVRLFISLMTIAFFCVGLDLYANLVGDRTSRVARSFYISRQPLLLERGRSETTVVLTHEQSEADTDANGEPTPFLFAYQRQRLSLEFHHAVTGYFNFALALRASKRSFLSQDPSLVNIGYETRRTQSFDGARFQVFLGISPAIAIDLQLNLPLGSPYNDGTNLPAEELVEVIVRQRFKVHLAPLYLILGGSFSTILPDAAVVLANQSGYHDYYKPGNAWHIQADVGVDIGSHLTLQSGLTYKSSGAFYLDSLPIDLIPDIPTMPNTDRDELAMRGRVNVRLMDHMAFFIKGYYPLMARNTVIFLNGFRSVEGQETLVPEFTYQDRYARLVRFHGGVSLGF